MNLARTCSFVLVLCACGAPARPDVDEAFRRIQVQEATIAHAQAGIEACGAERPCEAVEQACTAADEVCTIAEQLDDVDARSRCGMARRRCPEPR